MKNNKWSIGRKATNTSDILFDDETVSSSHAILYFLNGSYYIQDNSSTNGIL